MTKLYIPFLRAALKRLHFVKCILLVQKFNKKNFPAKTYTE